MRERTALVRVDGGRAAVSVPAERRPWRRRSPGAPSPCSGTASARRWPLRFAGGLLSAGLAALGASHWGGAAEGALSERLSEGCEEIEPCRQLEAEAAQRLQVCWLGCGSEAAEHRMARSLRFRAEERSAVRAHYRQRDAAERSEQQSERERRLADWQREQAAHGADAEREQRERLDLERLRQERIDRRIQEERQRRIAYLVLLAPEARLQRLERCHAEKAGCDALVLDLVEAAQGADEKRKLAEQNEQLLRGGVPVPRSAAPKLTPPAPNS
jgi:hypothetical protein